jgi:hypothetical protein
MMTMLCLKNGTGGKSVPFAGTLSTFRIPVLFGGSVARKAIYLLKVVMWYCD